MVEVGGSGACGIGWEGGLQGLAPQWVMIVTPGICTAFCALATWTCSRWPIHHPRSAPLPARLQVMALNAKDIPACFLGTAQLSLQVKDDAWRGERGWCRASAEVCCRLLCNGFCTIGCTLPPHTGKYQFVYITPEMASVSIDRLRALQQAAVRGQQQGQRCLLDA